jgi:hypothetical protein
VLAELLTFASMAREDCCRAVQARKFTSTQNFATRRTVVLVGRFWIECRATMINLIAGIAADEPLGTSRVQNR